jgi:hypothetical protein
VKAWLQRVALGGGALGTAVALGACRVQGDFPFSGTITNPCNNESINYSGVQHLAENEVPDGKDNGFNFVVHSNAQNVQGTGSLGNNYTLNESSTVSGHIFPGQLLNDPFALNAMSGTAPHFVINGVVQLTVDSSGNLEARVNTVTPSCPGSGG